MRRTHCVLAFATLALVVVPVGASTFLAMTDAELVRGADAIVQGKVVSQESDWDATGRVIVTEATVRVQTVLAGRADSLVTVRNFGGTVGDLSVDAIGFPRFREGERVVLFLIENPDGTSRVLGYQQGHFEVVERLDGVKVVVPRTEDGGTYLTRDGRLIQERGSVPLRDFKRGVRRMAREIRDTGAR